MNIYYSETTNFIKNLQSSGSNIMSINFVLGHTKCTQGL